MSIKIKIIAGMITMPIINHDTLNKKHSHVMTFFATKLYPAIPRTRYATSPARTPIHLKPLTSLAPHHCPPPPRRLHPTVHVHLPTLGCAALLRLPHAAAPAQHMQQPGGACGLPNHYWKVRGPHTGHSACSCPPAPVAPAPAPPLPLTPCLLLPFSV